MMEAENASVTFDICRVVLVKINWQHAVIIVISKLLTATDRKWELKLL
jgi:hypothetical protein